MAFTREKHAHVPLGLDLSECVADALEDFVSVHVAKGVSFRSENFAGGGGTRFGTRRISVARKAGGEFEGAVYHVLDRGERRDSIYTA